MKTDAHRHSSKLRQLDAEILSIDPREGAWQHHSAWVSESRSVFGSLFQTLCDAMDYIVHGILQARILEWVAFSISRGSSQPSDRQLVSHIADEFFTSWATREAQGVLPL